MAAALRPTDVLRQDPDAQWVALADGRLVIRHRGGASLIGGLPRADVEAVLAAVDGQRSAEEVCAALAANLDGPAVRRVLRRLWGEVLVPAGPEPPLGGRAQENAKGRKKSTGPADATTPAPLLLIGDGPLAEALATRFAALPLIVVRHPTPVLPTRDDLGLVLCAAEGHPYGELLALQRSCLAGGLVALFVTADPDGMRLGPTSVPAYGPCLGCAQLAALRFLDLPAADRLAVAGRFRTGPIKIESLSSRFLEAIVHEALAVLTDGERPALLGAILHRNSRGAMHRRPLQAADDCPLCAGLATPVELPARLALLADHEQIQLAEVRPCQAFAVSERAYTRVGILGGGTAGYLTALALRRLLPELEVALIESSAVPVIGVGEATTPLMPQFLHVDLGLDVHELFREVMPTLKLGIRFDWGPPGTPGFPYPFGTLHLLEGARYEGHIRHGSLRAQLMAADALPLWQGGDAATVEARFDTGIGYHLDNRRFVRYLQKKAAEQGVTPVDATIAAVERGADGETVAALVAEDGRRFAFDLYVDCSGFRSLLLGEALGSPFIDYSSSLFTDRALAAHAPHGGRPRPYTRAVAMDAGWCWSVPQTEADHRGYVFASAFLSPEAALEEMRQRNPGLGEPRLITFRPGRRAHFWKGNVVALGNAYGFVEPLESTSLHMLIRQIGLLVRALPGRRGERGVPAMLNRQVEALWDYLRFFLALHFRFNRQLDSPFWRACRQEVDITSHQELVDAFRERGPLSYERAARVAFAYPDPLWGSEGIDTLLLGQDVPTHLPQPATSRAAWHRLVARRHRLASCASTQAGALASAPQWLDAFARAFQRAGPAFGSTPLWPG